MKILVFDNVPTWAISFLYYGKDETGEITPEDIREIEEWRAREGVGEMLSEEEDESHFSRSPAFGEPCDCQACSFEESEKEEK